MKVKTKKCERCSIEYIINESSTQFHQTCKMKNIGFAKPRHFKNGYFKYEVDDNGADEVKWERIK